MKIDRSEEQRDAELLQQLIASEQWKTFQGLVMLTRSSTLNQLAYERDPVEMHRMQGMVQAVDILLNLPQEAIRSARNQSPEADV